MKTTSRVQLKGLRRLSSILLFLLFTIAEPAHAGTKLIHSIDFSKQPEGNAIPWFEQRGYLLKLDALDLDVTFNDNRLNLETKEEKTGIIGLQLKPENFLQDVRFIEIEWGVVRQPKGANWENGNNRVPIALMFFFGTEKISSGLPFGINSAPYFLSPFIGLNEQSGKVYTGKLYKEGGRYICVAVTPGSDEVIKSRIKVDPRFLKLFSKNQIPPITGVAFQMNTMDTEGGAHAFIRKIDFYTN